MIIIITLFIFGFIIIVILIVLTFAVIRSIDKVKMIKQTQLIHDKKHLKNLKNKEVLDNINCKI